MSALRVFRYSPTETAEADSNAFLDNLRKADVRFIIAGSHAYRKNLMIDYKPHDLDILVLGEENVVIVREMLEGAGMGYVMNSVKASHFDRFFRFGKNSLPKLFGCTIKTPDMDFNFKQVKDSKAVFWILRYPPLYFVEHVDLCTSQGNWDGHEVIDWRIGVLMVLKDEVRRRYLQKQNVPDRSDKIGNLNEHSRREMIDFLDSIAFEGNSVFALFFKLLMKRILHIGMDHRPWRKQKKK